jgi:outer membrane receptor protein involved in Fe transport
LTNQTESSEWSLNAMAYNARWTATDQVPLRAIEQGLIGRFGSLDPTTGGYSSRESISFNWQQRANNHLLQANFFAVRNALNLFSNFTYFTRACDSAGVSLSTALPCSDLALPTDQFEQVDRRFMLGADISYSFNHHFFEASSTTQIGIQTRQDQIDVVGLFETTARQRTGVVREEAAKETSVGVFVKNNTRWNAWLRSELGLRFDRFNFAVRPLDNGIPADRSASIVSPKASLVFGPWNKTELSVNWGEGFHSNDARGVTSQVDAATPLVHGDREQRLARLEGKANGCWTG